jgi:hypothetical protein
MTDDELAAIVAKDCRMAEGHWDKMTKRCKEKKM